MNYKLEKFWNSKYWITLLLAFIMNYKLEKFWNSPKVAPKRTFSAKMNYKLEKFWN